MEFIGCDPKNLRKLADRLVTAADTVARGGPAIQRAMANWHGNVPVGLLIQEATRLREDAQAMARRANLALTMDDKINFGGQELIHDPQWKTGVPWSPTDAQVAESARDDAHRLRDALANPKDKDSRATIREVGQSLEDRKNDPAYLHGFFAAGGADQMARLARTLNTRDGTRESTTLQPESEKLLGQYATALASATVMARDGHLPLPQGAFKPILHPKGDDMWSVAMLLKYGPSGDRYDAGFLADMGRSVLDWSKTHQQWPRYSYADPHDTWFASLRFNPDPLGNTTDYLEAVQANNPALNVLDRIGENPGASRALLSGPNGDGLDRAKQLIDQQWAPPSIDQPDAARPVAKVLIAATTDRSGDHAEHSAWAAANIFQAASDTYASDKKRSPEDKIQFPTMPPNISRALATVASGYFLDIARATDDIDSATMAFNDDGTWTVQTNPDVIDGLLHQIMRDPNAAGAFCGAVDAQLTAATMRRAEGFEEPTADLRDLGRLRGFIQVVVADRRWDPAEANDAQNARTQAYFEGVTGALGAIPGGQAVGWAQTALGFAAPLAKDGLFSTDNAKKAEAVSDREMYIAKNSMRPYIAQGLIASGQVHPPANARWIGPDGRINIRDRMEMATFNAWWSDLPLKFNTFEADAKTGFVDGADKLAPNDDAHKPDRDD